MIIQADGPSDAHAFWRTRPAPARLLAAQKLSLIYATFLLLPAAMVIATAIVAGDPRRGFARLGETGATSPQARSPWPPRPWPGNLFRANLVSYQCDITSVSLLKETSG